MNKLRDFISPGHRQLDETLYASPAQKPRPTASAASGRPMPPAATTTAAAAATTATTTGGVQRQLDAQSSDLLSDKPTAINPAIDSTPSPQSSALDHHPHRLDPHRLDAPAVATTLAAGDQSSQPTDDLASVASIKSGVIGYTPNTRPIDATNPEPAGSGITDTHVPLESFPDTSNQGTDRCFPLSGGVAPSYYASGGGQPGQAEIPKPSSTIPSSQHAGTATTSYFEQTPSQPRAGDLSREGLAGAAAAATGAATATPLTSHRDYEDEGFPMLPGAYPITPGPHSEALHPQITSVADRQAPGAVAERGEQKERGDSGPASFTSGPHKSNLLNIVDPRVRPDPANVVKHHKNVDPTETDPATWTIGPHQSNVLNIVDPRVRPEPEKMKHHHAGPTETDPATWTIGPHKSNLANIMDPRVQPEPSKMKGHTTAGPHRSDTLNQLDPNVDSNSAKTHHVRDDHSMATGVTAVGLGAYQADYHHPHHQQAHGSLNSQVEHASPYSSTALDPRVDSPPRTLASHEVAHPSARHNENSAEVGGGLGTAETISAYEARNPNQHGFVGNPAAVAAVAPATIAAIDEAPAHAALPATTAPVNPPTAEQETSPYPNQQAATVHSRYDSVHEDAVPRADWKHGIPMSTAMGATHNASEARYESPHQEAELAESEWVQEQQAYEAQEKRIPLREEKEKKKGGLFSFLHHHHHHHHNKDNKHVGEGLERQSSDVSRSSSEGSEKAKRMGSMTSRTGSVRNRLAKDPPKHAHKQRSNSPPQI